MTGWKAYRGRPLVEERRKFLELVGQGVSTSEASRIVGVNPRTGREWRNGRGERTKNSRARFDLGRKTVSKAVQPLAGEERTFIPHPLRATPAVIATPK
ncbi:helix-turn-helix domain-containing protein, partial [Streptomyces inhibens]|uniref:helix-turn-helix domain-containing protein n=1 Tax=Streptomyces inhibens TaxID=2293571 RepID=UPI0037B43A88